jgi:hypothetical protein
MRTSSLSTVKCSTIASLPGAVTKISSRAAACDGEHCFSDLVHTRISFRHSFRSVLLI